MGDSSQRSARAWLQITIDQPRDLLSLMLQSPWKETRKLYCTFAVSHLLQGGLVSERVLSRLDDESETGRDGLGGFGGF